MNMRALRQWDWNAVTATAPLRAALSIMTTRPPVINKAVQMQSSALWIYV